MVLPDAAAAEAWLLDAARTALGSGDRIDLRTVLLLRALAPGDPVVSAAIERLDPDDESAVEATVAARARHVTAALRIALDAGDDDLARRMVSDFESELLTVYRPGESLGSLAADVAVASLLLDIWDAGQQLPHQMMAEELMLIALRQHWRERRAAAFTVQSEAAHVFARLHHLTNRPEYYEHAAELLGDFAGTFRIHKLDAVDYVLALRLVTDGPPPGTGPAAL